MVTLYETLGVHDGASDDEIKRAYRKAAMRAHPDRNKGREAAAHNAFQEIKQAYAILADPEQRRVYDAVFAEEMRKLREHEEAEARAAREAREARDRQERECYERYVATAMRYAERGRNRDVVFGVLLGRGCDETLAARIADGIAALCASRAQALAVESEGERGRDPDKSAKPAAHADSSDTAEPELAAHAGLFGTLWHGMFGVRP